MEGERRIEKMFIMFACVLRSVSICFHTLTVFFSFWNLFIYFIFFKSDVVRHIKFNWFEKEKYNLDRKVKKTEKKSPFFVIIVSRFLANLKKRKKLLIVLMYVLKKMYKYKRNAYLSFKTLMKITFTRLSSVWFVFLFFVFKNNNNLLCYQKNSFSKRFKIRKLEIII